MGNRRRILVAAVTIAVVAGIMIYRSEPRYQGKSLSDWVVEMRAGPDREKAREVVHHIGPDHLPLLLQWLRREDHPSLKGRYYNLYEGLDGWLMNHKIVKRHSTSFPTDAKESYRILALMTFEELGPDGKGAIPALIKMLGNKNPKTTQASDTAGLAWVILPRLAPDYIAPLIQALSSPDPNVQILAASALANIGTNADAAIPILKTWLHDDRLEIRVAACEELGKFGVDPHEFMPVLIAGLPKTNIYGTNFDMLDYQIVILLRYKTNAKAAIPVLLQILTNTPNDNNPTNGWVRGDVTNAIHEIDPAAAAKAGIK